MPDDSSWYHHKFCQVNRPVRQVLVREEIIFHWGFTARPSPGPGTSGDGISFTTLSFLAKFAIKTGSMIFRPTYFMFASLILFYQILFCSNRYSSDFGKNGKPTSVNCSIR
jgi:hypothetical protein